MTAKGSINQRDELKNRALWSKRLYAEPLLPHVIAVKLGFGTAKSAVSHLERGLTRGEDREET